MKIDELIEKLDKNGEYISNSGIGDGTLLHQAAETIRLLWEVARENRLEKYKMQIDELGGAE